MKTYTFKIKFIDENEQVRVVSCLHTHLEVFYNSLKQTSSDFLKLIDFFKTKDIKLYVTASDYYDDGNDYIENDNFICNLEDVYNASSYVDWVSTLKTAL